MATRIARLHRWKGKCGCCEQKIEYNLAANLFVFEQDHFLPLSMGGPDVDANMWPLCLNCHRRKTQMETKFKFTKPWCPICETYYTATDDHPCFKSVKIARGVCVKPGKFKPCSDNLVHPEDWLAHFGYQV
jgi:hypothetical protein